MNTQDSKDKGIKKTIMTGSYKEITKLIKEGELPLGIIKEGINKKKMIPDSYGEIILQHKKEELEKEEKKPLVKNKNMDYEESIFYNLHAIVQLIPPNSSTIRYKELLDIKHLKEKLNVNLEQIESKRILNGGLEIITPINKQEDIHPKRMDYNVFQSLLEHQTKKDKSSLFFKNLKADDPLAKTTTRNYATVHKTKLIKEDAFLKIYQPPDITLEALLKEYNFEDTIIPFEEFNVLLKIINADLTFEEKMDLWSKVPTFPKLVSPKEKKEKELHILNLLYSKKVRVPKWYCHGKICGLDFMLQEKITGEQLNEFIEKNPKDKKNIISDAIEQLAEIHHYIDKELYEETGKQKTNKIDYYLEMFKNNFLEKYFSIFFNVNGKGYIIQHMSGKFKKDEINNSSHFDFNIKRRLIELFTPIAIELSNLTGGIYIDSNPSNILVSQNNKIYNIDFENVKNLPFQFDLSIFSAVLGLSDEEQTSIVNNYLKQKSLLEKKEIGDEETKAFHRGYNLVNILRNLVLVGNMHHYLVKYEDKQAAKGLLRYFGQSKKALKRAVCSQYATQRDKDIVNNFKKEFAKCHIHYYIDESLF